MHHANAMQKNKYNKFKKANTSCNAKNKTSLEVFN